MKLDLKNLKKLLDYFENNSTVDNRLMRFKLKYSRCPPNKYENKKGYKKYGTKKPKYKNKCK